MAEPIVVDGGAEKITITLPASFKQESPGVFVIQPDKGDPFKSIVVRDEEEPEESKREKFKHVGLKRKWKIKIE